MAVKSNYSNVEPKPIEQANTGGNQGAYENVMKQEEEQNEIAQGGSGKTEKDPMDAFIAGSTSGEPSQGENGEPENPLTAMTNMFGSMFDNIGGMKKDSTGQSVNDTYQAPGEPDTEDQHGGVGGSQENNESMNKALESIEGFSNNNSSTRLQPANFQSGGQKNKHPLVAGDKVGSGKVAIATEYGGGNQQGTNDMFKGGTQNNLKEDANAEYDGGALTSEETDKALKNLQEGGAKRKTKRNKKSRKTRKTRKTLKRKKTKTTRKSKNSLKKKKTKGKKSSKHQRKTVRKRRKSKVQKRK
jgi:hypothetical protein